MNARIPICYDRVLRPEWLDYALQQSVLTTDEQELARVLRTHLSSEISTETTLRKTVRQLVLIVGPPSPVQRDQIIALYDLMRSLAPQQRKVYRFRLLLDTTPFVADVVDAFSKLALLGVKGVPVQQLYERLFSKYGDRGTIPARVRCALQTLVHFGALENREKKWVPVDPDLWTAAQR